MAKRIQRIDVENWIAQGVQSELDAEEQAICQTIAQVYDSFLTMRSQKTSWTDLSELLELHLGLHLSPQKLSSYMNQEQQRRNIQK